MKTAAIYARVSSAQQREEHTIASQTAALVAFAASEDYCVPAEWIFEDEGYSGASLLRPGLERVRDLAAEGQIEAVLVLSPDRLSRKYAYQVLLTEEWARQGVATVFLRTPRSETPEDQLLLQFQGMIAEYERAQILERSRRGKRHRAQLGEVSVLSGAPYGYRYVRKSDEANARYEVIEAQAEVVRQVYDLYTAGGLSIGAITRRLNEQEVPTRKEGSRWERSTVWAMLRNPAYKGQACFGKTQVAARQRLNRLARQRGGLPVRNSASLERPREEWLEIAVPALIHEETFALAEERLVVNKKYAARRTVEPSLLQGLVHCRQCGYALYRTSTRSTARKIFYYRCLGSDAYRYEGQARCDQRPIRLDLLESIVWAEVLRLLEDPALIQSELDRRLEVARQTHPAQRRQETLSRDLAQVQKGMERLLTAYQEDLLSLEELRRRMPALRQRELALQAEVASLSAQFSDQAAYLRLAETLSAFLGRMRENVHTLDIVERQRIVRLLVKEVVVGSDTITIRHSIPTPVRSSGNPDDSSTQHQSSGGQRSAASYPLCTRSDRSPLWGAASGVPVGRRPFPVTVSIVLFHWRFQPLLDEVQNVPINDPTGDALHQLGVRNAIEIAGEIRIDDLPVAGVQQTMNRLYRVLRSPLCPVGVLLRLQVGFEDRFQHEHRRRLNHPVGDRRYPQGAQLAVRLGNPDPFDRFRSVVFLLQPFRQFPEPAFFSVCFDVFESHSIHPGGSLVGFAASVGMVEHVPSMNLVVQEVEPVPGFFLRFGM
jgi:site-specific DNA recombinase